MKNNIIKNKKPLVMGIFNFSKNSFYSSSVFSLESDQNIKELIKYCDIIDIGAESTHPGSDPITSQEEIDILKPVIEYFNQYDIPISVDTYKSKTAEFAILNNVNIINDISGGILDNNMFDVISSSNIYYILGHIQNTPKNMQDNPLYFDIISEIKIHFTSQIDILTKKGFNRNNIILDPCIGFGKSLDNNIEILKNINQFKSFGLPVLIGTSRKSFHKQLVNINNNYEMFLANLTTNIYSIINGVNIIRVHDPKEFRFVTDILEKIM